ncbi:MAG TPA: GntP family permease [Chryseosolibacter sp.]
MKTAELIILLVGLLVSISTLVLLNRYLKLHAFFCLLIASLILGIITNISFAQILTAMQNGFGSLLAQIGFVVALGSCLGVMLEKTGAMHIIAQKILAAFGKKRSLKAMSALGLLVGIPVFCDSGFIILSRLIPTIAAQSGVPGSSLALALSSGLYTTHSLVPPTPGPLAAAVNLGLAENMGTVILIGILGSIPVGFTGYLLSKNLGKNFFVHLKEVHPERGHENLSSTKAFLPLVTPIVLITLATLPKIIGFTGIVAQVLAILGQPFIALAIGLLLTIPLIRKRDKDWPDWINSALMDAGIILLITGAGGAFGSVIRESGLESILKGVFSDYKVFGSLFICFAFMISGLLKTAQGSTTSAMIITTSLIAPLLAPAGFHNPVHLATIVLAIGSGGMCVSHANDSYFWVVSQFGGIPPDVALSNFTRITFFQGLTGLVTAVVIFFLW